jgi:hypothetical protein
MFEINEHSGATVSAFHSRPTGQAPRFSAASMFVGLAALTTAREFKSDMLTPITAFLPLRHFLSQE